MGPQLKFRMRIFFFFLPVPANVDSYMAQLYCSKQCDPRGDDEELREAKKKRLIVSYTHEKKTGQRSIFVRASGGPHRIPIIVEWLKV